MDRAHVEISIRRQCELLGMNRSGLYYEPRGENEENLVLMRLLDEQYTRAPFYGSRKMAEWLGGQGFHVNRKRISRLMALMGIEAVYPKPKLSQPGEGHKIYPYLLRGVGVNRVNQVWSTDITYIRMAQGFVYLVAVMDWFSRYVLSWRLSLSMELEFCVEALRCALRHGRPEIFNSDQGSQFTSEKFTSELAAREIAISMDGRGRCLDNIFIERLWRSLKYEEVYLKDYTSVSEARAGIERYFRFYKPRAAAPESRIPDTGSHLAGARLTVMTRQLNKERISIELGDPSPNPWDLSLSGQNDWLYIEGTRTEDKAPQGCDLSAASSAGMATDGFDPEAVPKFKIRPVAH